MPVKLVFLGACSIGLSTVLNLLSASEYLDIHESWSHSRGCETDCHNTHTYAISLLGNKTTEKNVIWIFVLNAHDGCSCC